MRKAEIETSFPVWQTELRVDAGLRSSEIKVGVGLTEVDLVVGIETLKAKFSIKYNLRRLKKM